MGKGDRRGKKKTPLPAVAPVPKKQPNGRKRRRASHIGERNPARVVLEARARHTGNTGKDIDAMRTQALGEPAGQAIYAAHSGDKAKRLWDAYAGYTAAEAVYAKTYLGMRLHAKTAKVEYMIETFEARADDRPDDRTEEERARDATNNWMRWRGHIMHLSRPMQKAIMDAAYGQGDLLRDTKLTAKGRRFVEAVEALADVVERKRQQE